MLSGTSVYCQRPTASDDSTHSAPSPRLGPSPWSSQRTAKPQSTAGGSLPNPPKVVTGADPAQPFDQGWNSYAPSPSECIGSCEMGWNVSPSMQDTPSVYVLSTGYVEDDVGELSESPALQIRYF